MMKINRVECDQFAGIQRKELCFDNGLNILLGENETGKSTIIDLIYLMLFKEVKLRRDANFIEKYFPKKMNGPQGDVIDGKIEFETKNGNYILKKEWEQGEGFCKLILPDGTSIKGADQINEILSKELEYRAGVYNEIVFASQKRDQMAVESIMKVLTKNMKDLSQTREDLTSTLKQAALETGGVSLEKIEKEIQNKISNLISHWDYNNNLPEGGVKRGINNKWKQGVGEILDAYYEMEICRQNQIDTDNAEKLYEKQTAILRDVQQSKKLVEIKKSDFQKCRGQLENFKLLSQNIEDQIKKIEEKKKILLNWPNLYADIKKAKNLQQKERQAMIHSIYMRVKPIKKEYDEKQKIFSQLKEVEAEDIKNYRNLILDKQKEENKLAGMNLIAKITQLGDAPIEIKSITSGTIMNVEEESIHINEAVDIKVPGVMEIQLLPKGIDVDLVKDTIQNYNESIQKINKKYEIHNLEELLEKTDYFSSIKQDIEVLKMKIEKNLGIEKWESIEKENNIIPLDIESEEEIKRQIKNLCGTKPIDSYIGANEAYVNDYESKYQSEENLEKSIEIDELELKNKQSNLKSIDEIPLEFQGIKNPEEYNQELENMIEEFERKFEEQDTKLREIEKGLGEKTSDEYLEELQEKELIFNDKKIEYQHWLNIYNVFTNLKQQTGGISIQDIESKFREYLTQLTDGKIKLTDIDEKISVNLASGVHPLTFEILSEGTKDTISLAFRLAMLEHLYPNGDGLAIFDDPFTDMDPKRVKQACNLIQKFAEKNQVIFITCDDKYEKLLSGNIINLSN